MITNRLKPVLFLALFFILSLGFAQKKNIIILATGGTIAGQAASGTTAGYTSGQATIESMIESVPGASDLAIIKGEQIANVGSQDMSFEIMVKLRNRINEIAKKGEADGVVVTHGTDTMEETSYFLDLTINTDMPVVLVGSMRPSTAVSADGPLNLFNAIGVAADDMSKNRGVLVVMNDQIHDARSLVKSNTNSIETFISPLSGPLGTVKYGQSTFFRAPYRKHTVNSEFATLKIKKLPRVDVQYACADMPADMIQASIDNGAKGIVIAGVGNGNLNNTTLEEVKKAAANGTPVVRSSRVLTGSIGRNVEVNDDEVGTIASDDLNPAKARILLMLCILSKKSSKETQEIFFTY